MARVVPIGIQNFEKLVSNDSFYVDKTEFDFLIFQGI